MNTVSFAFPDTHVLLATVADGGQTSGYFGIKEH